MLHSLQMASQHRKAEEMRRTTPNNTSRPDPKNTPNSGSMLDRLQLSAQRRKEEEARKAAPKTTPQPKSKNTAESVSMLDRLKMASQRKAIPEPEKEYDVLEWRNKHNQAMEVRYFAKERSDEEIAVAEENVKYAVNEANTFYKHEPFPSDAFVIVGRDGNRIKSIFISEKKDLSIYRDNYAKSERGAIAGTLKDFYFLLRHM